LYNLLLYCLDKDLNNVINVDIIKELIEGDEGEKAKSMYNKNNDTPLHIAIDKNLSKEIIELLCTGVEGEKAKSMYNKNNDTPLHIAINKNLSKEIIELLK